MRHLPHASPGAPQRFERGILPTLQRSGRTCERVQEPRRKIWSMQQPDFFTAFDTDHRFTNELGSFRCDTRPIGEVAVPSGRIVIGAPLVDLAAPPLSQRVPPGRYPVILAIAHLESTEGVDERIAC